MGIIGVGFVGGSVAHGFDRNVDPIIVDPKVSDFSIDDLVARDPTLIFVCVPTPSASNGEVDVSIADGVLKELDENHFEGVVVIKSTIVPNHLTRFKEQYDLRIVYNPEFLTEANAHWDFCNPPMQILGGDWNDCEVVERAYVHHSSVRVVPTFKTDIATASLLKYTINSWLATKVMFMNEMKDLFDASDTESSWEQFTDMLSRDVRIGNSHMQVPGPDGSKGFGGHCFPKDTKGLLHYAAEQGVLMTVLTQAVASNEVARDE